MELVEAKPIDNKPAMTVKELNSITNGDFVRLGLKSGERFWARVVQTRTGGFKGIAADSLPEFQVKMGDWMFFDKSNVFGIV